jgi:hypothetical protein
MMTRRQFLCVVALLSTFGRVAFSFAQKRPDRVGTEPELPMTRSEIRQCLHGVFSDPDSPRVLGRRYLDLYPHEQDRSLLLAEYIQSARVRTSDVLRTILAHKCEADFKNGEMVMIDGFLLARTEVEACALTVLL